MFCKHSDSLQTIVLNIVFFIIKVRFCFGQDKEMEQEYSQLFGCKSGSYPFRYLGIPMHYRKLSNADWRIIEEKFEKKKLSTWKGKYDCWRPSSPN
jgi:hypothetical protein